eukprot:5693044-Pleurochrysis_carterae.AAC.2
MHQLCAKLPQTCITMLVRSRVRGSEIKLSQDCLGMGQAVRQQAYKCNYLHPLVDTFIEVYSELAPVAGLTTVGMRHAPSCYYYNADVRTGCQKRYKHTDSHVRRSAICATPDSKTSVYLPYPAC